MVLRLAPCSALLPSCLEIRAHFGFSASITEGQIIIIENGPAFSRTRLSRYPVRLGHCEPLYGIFPNVSQVRPLIDIDLEGSLFGPAGLARTMVGPVCLLSYRAVPPGVQETAI
jgi:hypothetical protein